MATFSNERVAELTATVVVSPNRAQLIVQLSRLAERKPLTSNLPETCREYLQTVEALFFNGESEKKSFLLWLTWLLSEESLPFDNARLLPLLRDVYDLVSGYNNAIQMNFAIHNINLVKSNANLVSLVKSVEKVMLLHDFLLWSKLLQRTQDVAIWSKVLTIWVNSLSFYTGYARFVDKLATQFDVATKRVNSLMRLANRLEERGFAFPFLDTALDMHTWCTTKRQCVFVEETLLRLSKCNFFEGHWANVPSVLAFLAVVSQDILLKTNPNANPYLLGKAVASFLTDEGMVLYCEKHGINTLEELLSGQSDLAENNRLPVLFTFCFQLNNHSILSLKRVMQYLPSYVLNNLNAWSNRRLETTVVNHLVFGKNIRSLFPFLTKKEAHIFGQLEGVTNVVDAIWRAKVIATDGSTELRTLLNRYQPTHLDTVAFWSEVIVFLVKNEALALTNGYYAERISSSN